MLSLALETRKTGLLTLFYTTKEVLVGGIQIPQGRLQRDRVHFTEPWKLFLQGGHISGAGFVAKCRFIRLVGVDTLGKVIVIDEAAASKGSLYLNRLLFCRVDTKSVTMLHEITALHT